MNKKTEEKLTIGITYIFVKPISDSNSSPIRVVLPKSLQSLKDLIAKEMKSKHPITKVFDSCGNEIKDITDVLPGDVIFPSIEKSTTFSKISAPGKKAAELPKEKKPSAFLDNGKRLSLPEKQESTKEDKEAEESEQKPRQRSFIPTRRVRRQPSPEAENASPTEFLGSEAILTESQRLSGPNDGTSSEENSEEESERSFDRKSAYESSSIIEETAEAEDTGKIEKIQEIEAQEKAEEPQRSERNELTESFSFALKMDSEAIGHAIASLPTQTQEDLSDIIAFEKADRIAWVNSVFSVVRDQELSWNPMNLIHSNEVIDWSRKILSMHRSGGSFSMRMGVVGSPSSGRSTALSSITHQLVLELAASGEWKSTFLFVANGQVLPLYSGDIKEYYLQIIRYLFLLISNQIQNDAIDAVRKSFEDVAEYNGRASIPQRLLTDDKLKIIMKRVQSVLSGLCRTWASQCTLQEKMYSILGLITAIPKALGYSSIFIVIDHYDSLDLEITDEKMNQFRMIDFWGSPLCCSQFILGSSDTEKFFTSINCLGRDQFGVQNSVELIDTNGIVNEIDYADCELIVDLQNGQNISFGSGICGGNPAFLASWYSINEQIDLLEYGEDGGEEETEEILTQLHSLMDGFLKAVIRSSQKMDFKDVHRRVIE